MEDDLNFLENGRQPKFEIRWKTASISQHLAVNVDQVTLQEYNRTQIGRRPQLF